MNLKSGLLVLFLAVPLSALLISCGQKNARVEVDWHPSSGQVSNKTATTVSHYAAARFADQVSFGATPQLVAEIEQKGFSKWIDDQFALPVSKIDPSPAKVYDDQDRVKAQEVGNYTSNQIYSAMLSSPDQLRHRVSLAMSQFVVVSRGKIQEYGTMLYANFLQEHALGNYGTFIRALSVNPPMGGYLDNISNRPTSSECLGCAPNENYARELMQLFTLGVVKLNLDGTTVRDAKNKPVETYSQEDVEQLAAALTGWTWATHSPKYDYGRFDGALVPETWEPLHDRREKKILGTTLPAGKEAAAELESISAILMAHQNIAPFVSLRLIQHLVTSNPTPAYIARIATVFRNNGQGVTGDMKAVVKAILLDVEARAGDQIGADTSRFGKMREPLLWYTGLLRGLGCSKPLRWRDGGVTMGTQQAFNPNSVFSFYAPTDRAPGSNLLSPEQKLLNTPEFSDRFGGFDVRFAPNTTASGCQVNPFGQAFNESPQALVNLINARYFRGAMPPTLRQNLIELAPTVWGEDSNGKALALLLYALATPYYGVIR